MQNEIKQAILQIEQFEMTEDGIKEFEASLNKLIETKKIELGIEALFEVFEKYPEEESAFGLFWTAIHAIEKMPGFNIEVLASLKRKPSMATILMAKRILNSKKKVDKRQLKATLNEIVENRTYSDSIRKSAKSFLASE